MQLSTSASITIGIALLGLVACGSYDQSSGLIEMGGVGRARDVRINELMTQGGDWVELYNAGDEDVSLEGYFVSDRADDPTKFELPAEAVVPANGFLMLWANDGSEPIQLSFGLSSGGEGFWLMTPEGIEVDSVAFGVAPGGGASYAWYPDGADGSAGGTWEWCENPTPNAQNGEVCQ